MRLYDQSEYKGVAGDVGVRLKHAVSLIIIVRAPPVAQFAARKRRIDEHCFDPLIRSQVMPVGVERNARVGKDRVARRRGASL